MYTHVKNDSRALTHEVSTITPARLSVAHSRNSEEKARCNYSTARKIRAETRSENKARSNESTPDYTTSDEGGQSVILSMRMGIKKCFRFDGDTEGLLYRLF
jgi:hypothetical protein